MRFATVVAAMILADALTTATSKPAPDSVGIVAGILLMLLIMDIVDLFK